MIRILAGDKVGMMITVLLRCFFTIGSALKCFFAIQPEFQCVRIQNNTHHNHREKGYLLIAISIVSILIVAVFLSIIQYRARIDQLNRFYTLGQQLAILARGVHAYEQSQNRDYVSSPNMGISYNVSIVRNRGYLNQNFSLLRIRQVDPAINIQARFSPRNLPLTLRGASAYIGIDLTFPQGEGPSPAELSALKAGAASAGLPIGFPLNPRQYGITNADKPSQTVISDIRRPRCLLADGTQVAAYIIWGEGPYDCMGRTDASSIVGAVDNMDYYDMILPAWIPAQSDLDTNAVFRIPQPGLPMVNTMQTNLNMAGNQIQGVNLLDVDTISATGNMIVTSPITLGSATIRNDVSGVQGVNQPDTGTATIGTLNNTGEATFLSADGNGATISTTGTMTATTLNGVNDAISIDTGGGDIDINSMELTSTATSLTTSGNMRAGSRDFDVLGDVTVGNIGAQHIAVGSALGSPPISGTLTVNGGVQAESMDVVDGDVSTNQNVTISGECYGACPDIAEPPVDPPFE